MTAPLFPPPEGFAHLYVGKVMHARLKPIGHRFSYGVATLLVDVARVERAIQVLGGRGLRDQLQMIDVSEREQ